MKRYFSVLKNYSSDDYSELIESMEKLERLRSNKNQHYKNQTNKKNKNQIKKQNKSITSVSSQSSRISQKLSDYISKIQSQNYANQNEERNQQQIDEIMSMTSTCCPSENSPHILNNSFNENVKQLQPNVCLIIYLIKLKE